jgi:beta-glucosidase
MGAYYRYNTISPEIDARVTALMARMTLEEKVGQMVQSVRTPDVEERIRAGAVGSILSLPDRLEVNRLQRVAVEQTRLGIPLIVGFDVIHGHNTIFPIPLAEACTWNPALLEEAAKVAASEAAVCGIDWIFAPMVDICRDPRWGRIAEGAGEDPFLGAAMARARVRGFQAVGLPGGKKIVACPKHYVAYGAAEAGKDYATTDMSERTLRDVFLPPFHAAFEEGAGSTMSAFNDLNGVPTSANPFTLRTVLRDEWGWEGAVVSDYNSIGELIPHGIAGDLKEAALKAVLAGVEMDMMAGAFPAHLVELVQEGVVPMEVIDASVRHILALKFALGLFEQPYTDESLHAQVVLQPAFKEKALEVAQQSMVLLKNEANLLPLDPRKGKIAVLGPLADDHYSPRGMWAWMGRPRDVESVLDGIKTVFTGASIVHEKGCEIVERRLDEHGIDWRRVDLRGIGDVESLEIVRRIRQGTAFSHWDLDPASLERVDLGATLSRLGLTSAEIPGEDIARIQAAQPPAPSMEAAVAAAAAADVAIVVLGESEDMSGEAHSRAYLDLPGRQQELLEKVVATGTRVVLVVMTGRPVTIPWADEHVPAILQAWHGGIRTGRAVADILSGAVNPSAKLSVSFPRTVGQIPVYYAHKNTGRPALGAGTTQFTDPFRSTWIDETNDPLYPFGYGLSYTCFTYEVLKVATPEVRRDGALVVSAMVSNTGARAGEEIVQLYVRDLVGSVTRPVKELKGFQRVALAPGETREVLFEVPVESLGFHGLDNMWTVEPGAFHVWIGPSSAEGLKGEFRVVE